jgi:hypothetical protein
MPTWSDSKRRVFDPGERFRIMKMQLVFFSSDLVCGMFVPVSSTSGDILLQDLNM